MHILLKYTWNILQDHTSSHEANLNKQNGWKHTNYLPIDNGLKLEVNSRSKPESSPNMWELNNTLEQLVNQGRISQRKLENTLRKYNIPKVIGCSKKQYSEGKV